MATPQPPRNMIHRNLANIASFLGVLPICLILGENGFEYLLPFIIYNNAMDDLDGVLAAKLNIRSQFGALLDNVCDAIAHTVIVVVVGLHVAQTAEIPALGLVCLATSLLAFVSIVIRIVTRIGPAFVGGKGSPTNELIRHIFFALLLANVFKFDPAIFLIVIFVLHSVSMLFPFRMPYLIRSQFKSAFSIAMVNVSLLLAWLLPVVAPVVAGLFIATYAASFASGAWHCWQGREKVYS